MTTTKPLDQMSVDELKALKRRWYTEARESGKLRVIATVARETGTDINARYGPKYAWRRGDITIFLDDYGHYFTVRVDGQQVCSTHGDPYGLFIPGDWYDTIASHLPVAEQAMQQRQDDEIERQRQQLLAELTAISGYSTTAQIDWSECTTEYDTWRTALITHVVTGRTFYVAWERCYQDGRIVDIMTRLSERIATPTRAAQWSLQKIELLDPRIERLTNELYDNPDLLLDAAEKAVLVLVGEPADITTISGYDAGDWLMHSSGGLIRESRMPDRDTQGAWKPRETTPVTCPVCGAPGLRSCTCDWLDAEMPAPDPVELTILFPSLLLRDDDGRLWKPFDHSSSAHQGEPGRYCVNCGHDTWRGFRRRVGRHEDAYEYICPACVTLVNPGAIGDE